MRRLQKALYDLHSDFQKTNAQLEMREREASAGDHKDRCRLQRGEAGLVCVGHAALPALPRPNSVMQNVTMPFTYLYILLLSGLSSLCQLFFVCG